MGCFSWGQESRGALCLCKEFFKEHPSGKQGDIIFLDTPTYNKNIYLVTLASLHPKQLFSSSKHSSFQARKGSVLHGVARVASRPGASILEPAPCLPGSRESNIAKG